MTHLENFFQSADDHLLTSQLLFENVLTIQGLQVFGGKQLVTRVCRCSPTDLAAVRVNECRRRPVTAAGIVECSHDRDLQLFALNNLTRIKKTDSGKQLQVTADRACRCLAEREKNRTPCVTLQSGATPLSAYISPTLPCFPHSPDLRETCL